MKEKDRDVIEQRAVALIADQQTAQITEASARIIADANGLVALTKQWKNAAADITKGRIFELLEVVKFNANALGKGRTDIYTYTTASQGKGTHPVDIFIKQVGKKRTPAQAKCCNDAVNSLFLSSNSKYTGMKRVIPQDQVKRFRELARARIETGTLKKIEYADALLHVDDHGGLSQDGVASGGTTLAEAKNNTDTTVAGKTASRYRGKAIRSEMHHSGHKAGKTGAMVAGGMSAVNSLLRLARGDADAGEVAAQVVVESAKGYVVGYANTAISKGIPHAAIKFGMTESAAKVLTKSNAHLAIAAGVVQSSKSIGHYLRGKIDGAQMMDEIGHTAITGASAFYYGALGQAIIPVPVLGAFVGSTVGYFVGNMLHQSGLVALGESAVARVARERREHIRDMCMTAIPLMRSHRLELESLIEEHFAQRRRMLINAFDGLENALIEWDADEYTAQLERVNRAFGKSLPFGTLEEFNEMMADDDRVFVL